MTVEHVRSIAQQIRRDALEIIYAAGSGHPGGALSCADLIAHIACHELHWPQFDANELNRPRFVLSKGHACPALYAAAAATGLINREDLASFRRLNGKLQGHPHVINTPWAETSTGSLGQGFSVAIGMAMGLRHQNSSAPVMAMLGDGELQEGEVWEGAMCAGHYRLNQLIAIIDYNKLQSDDLNANIMGLEPLRAKWEAFNWHVIEIDGHDLVAIATAFNRARTQTQQPTAIIAHTVKGKGVTFMEGAPQWHGSVKLRGEELARALQDLAAAGP